jgi:hypothetical protein
MARYRGVIENHVTMKSKDKGTPGIEFRVNLREIQQAGAWKPIDWIDRDCTIYFSPGGDHSWSMKKLAFAGFTGGVPLSQMNLRGNTVEVVSNFETYDGKEREKFELSLPPREPSAADGNAELAIDAVLSAMPVPAVKLPTALDPDAKPPEPGTAKSRPQAATPASSVDPGLQGTAYDNSAPATPLDDDEVPF